MSSTNNPLPSFIKGEFLKSPLERRIRGLSDCYAFNFEIPEHEHLIIHKKLGKSS